MKRLIDLINDVLPDIKEIFPWDLEQRIKENSNLMLLDIREPYEFEVMCIENSLNVPRGVLETACDWGFEETVPEIACCREREVVIICRSGNRSALAAKTMQQMGYKNVCSLKTGLTGWNDYELPLIDQEERIVTLEEGDSFFEPKVRPEQMPPV
jgi:rhodanese-related sulfurtransferase